MGGRGSPVNRHTLKERNTDYAMYMKVVSQRAELEPARLFWVGLGVLIWIPGCGLSHLFIALRVEVQGRGAGRAGCCPLLLLEHLCPLLQGKDVQKGLSQLGSSAVTRGKCQTDVLGEWKREMRSTL